MNMTHVARSCRFTVAFTLLALCAAVPGCNTLSDAREARGTGTSQVYDAGFERVWEIVPRAANDCDLSVAGTFKKDRYILADRGTTLFSWGERVAIFVDPVTVSRTSVEVVSKRAVAVNITATDFENMVLDRIRTLLAGAE